MSRKPKKNEIKRDDDDYLESLHIQLDFLIDSCEKFDIGKFHYAKQIAKDIRVLVHQTRDSTSLLTWLEKQNSMNFCSTASLPKNAVYFIGLVTPTNRIVLNDSGNQFIEHTFLPILNSNKTIGKKWINFENWYNHPVLVCNPTSISRKDIITYLANKDGGAHVDSYVDENIYKISKGINSLVYATDKPLEEDPYQKGEPFINLINAAARQIAHELILSIRKEFGIRPSYNPTHKYLLNGGNLQNIDEVLMCEGTQIEYLI